MSEVERCPECGGLAGPDGVLSHGYVHVRHETGGGGMNRRCSQTPKPEEPTVVAGGGGYDPRALTALAKNLDKARDWAAWFAAEAAYWRESLLDAPAPTIDIQDVQFRMLEPAEIIAAMDFPDYYRVLGNRREKVRMAGNAVTPCAARDLVAVVAEALS